MWFTEQQTYPELERAVVEARIRREERESQRRGARLRGRRERLRRVGRALRWTPGA